MACAEENHTDANLTSTFVPAARSEARLLYQDIEHVVKNILLPIVFTFGITGNALNIAVFTQKRLRHGLDKIELSATLGLLALSVSDLVFCVAGFPAVFLDRYLGGGLAAGAVIAQYYSVYKGALMNLFLFTSTWLIVLVAAERYIAVCHPFKARCFIKIRRTIGAQVCVFVFSFVLNLPLFLVWRVERVQCVPYCYCLVRKPWLMSQNKPFAHAHRTIWFALGTFLPLFLLVLFNSRILCELYRSARRGVADTEASSSSSRITLILVTMIILFVLMVCPSMILEFLRGHIDFLQMSDTFIHNFRTAVVLTNLTQAMKFSCNFLLYCSINKKFREAISKVQCFGSGSDKSVTDDPASKYRLVELTSQRTNVTSMKYDSYCA